MVELPDAIEFKTLSSLAAIDRADWDRLTVSAPPFLEYDFLRALEVAGCLDPETGWQPAIIGAYRAGDLVGAIPLYETTNSEGEFVFDWAWADAAHRAGLPYYPKGVAGVPFTPVTGPRLLVDPDIDEPRPLKKALIKRAIKVSDARRWSSLHFNFIDRQEVALFDELGLPVRLGLQYHWHNRDGQGSECDNFDAFLGRFRSKKRSNIRRERRRLADRGITTEVIQGQSITADDIEQAFLFYRDTVDNHPFGRRYLNRDFFFELFDRLRHRLHLVFIYRDDAPFGGTFNLLKDRRLYGRYWGCLEDIEFAHFETCIYRPVEWAIDQGLQAFEPGAGGDHKFSRGFLPRLTYSAHHIAHPGLNRAVTQFIDVERREILARQHQLFEQSPFKATHQSAPTAPPIAIDAAATSTP